MSPAFFTIQRQGSVLLFALLFLAGGILGGLTAAVLVISELRQSRQLDDAFIAFTEAESGLEQALFSVRRDDTCTTDYTTCNITDFPSVALPSCPNSSSLGCNLNRNIYFTKQVQTPFIGQDQTFTIDISDADKVTGLSLDSWSWHNTANRSAAPQLEVTYVVNDGAGSTAVCRAQAGLPINCNADANEINCDNISLSVPSATIGPGLGNDCLTQLSCPAEASNKTCTNQIRFKALRNDVLNLSASVTAPVDSSLSNYVKVESRGVWNNATQTLSVLIPRLTTVYGFSDYVIFSEFDIVKNVQ